MNVSFDSKYCLYFFASPKKYEKGGPKTMYIAFSGGASIKLCATVVNSIGALIGS